MGWRIAGGMLVVMLAAACDRGTVSGLLRDTHPVRLAVPDLQAPIFDEDVHPIAVPVQNAAGEDLHLQVALSGLPANIVETAGDSFRCRATGDATLIFSGGGLSTNAVVHCRPVRTVRVSSPITLTVGENPIGLSATALNEAGEAVEGVPIQVTSVDDSVAAIANTAVRGLQVGTTTLRYSVGSRALAEAHVLVRQRIFAQPLLLGDGATQTRTLQQGRYQIEVQVEQSGGDINVSWVGAACPDSSGVYRYNTVCTVPSTASLTITNPTLLGLGSNAQGFVTMYLVPTEL